MRADAKRNYDRIVAVAREVFREQGYDASLDEVAKRAGVGPGTLYRHFPNRDALLDAIMQNWVDQVDEAADKDLEAALSAEIIDVIKSVEDLPPPPRTSLFDDVYASLPWHLEAQRAELERTPPAPAH